MAITGGLSPLSQAFDAVKAWLDQEPEPLLLLPHDSESAQSPQEAARAHERSSLNAHATAESLGTLIGAGCLLSPVTIAATPWCMGAGSVLGSMAADLYVDGAVDKPRTLLKAGVVVAAGALGSASSAMTAGIEAFAPRLAASSVLLAAEINAVNGVLVYAETHDKDAALTAASDWREGSFTALTIGAFGVAGYAVGLRARAAAIAASKAAQTPEGRMLQVLKQRAEEIAQGLPSEGRPLYVKKGAGGKVHLDPRAALKAEPSHPVARGGLDPRSAEIFYQAKNSLDMRNIERLLELAEDAKKFVD